MNFRDFALMYPKWRQMMPGERVARMIAFRAFEPPPGTPPATCGALTKAYVDEHWQEYLQTAGAIIDEVRRGGRAVG